MRANEVTLQWKIATTIPMVCGDRRMQRLKFAVGPKMLNREAGTVNDPNENEIIVAKGFRGHGVYGPYSTITPGQYQVTFAIAALDDDFDEQNEICAVVDVVADFGRRVIAACPVLRSDLDGQTKVQLNFELDAPSHQCEFRVFSTGLVSIRLWDNPELKQCEDQKKRTTASRIDAKLLSNLWENGVRIDTQGSDIVIRATDFERFTHYLMSVEVDRRALAERVVEAVGYRGCEENSLFRAFVGTERPLVSPPERVPFASSLCHQAHFGYEQYRFWTKALKETPKYQRKQWEFVYIAQALYERGFLKPGMKGLVFGAGQEQLPALFASFGVKVLATDQAPDLAVESGWIDSGQHTFDMALLNQRSICTDRIFSELVSFKAVDMNAIPAELDGQYDFCWSACALEHLGSLEKGLAFIENSLRTLKPGGLAVHTTEYNITSNTDTIENYGLSLFRRCDIDAFITRMAAAGHEVSPIDWELGEGFAEMVTDLAPYAARGEPHIRLMAGQYEITSVGLIVRKAAH